MMRLWALVAMTVAGSASGFADEVPQFRWQRAIRLPELTETLPVAVTLDSSFFAGTRTGFPDVRVRDASGQSRAFLIRPAETTKQVTSRSYWSSQRTGAAVNDQSGILLELGLAKDDPQPTGIRIVTPLHDFEQQVTVEASGNGQEWVPQGEPKIIFDYQRVVDARQVEIALPPSQYRRFRVRVQGISSDLPAPWLQYQERVQGAVIVDQTEYRQVMRRPFRIDNVEFYRDVVAERPDEPILQSYPSVDLQVTEDAKQQTTIVEFTTQHEPLTRVALETTSQNFQRSVRLERQEIREGRSPAWQTVSSGVLLHVNVGPVQKSALELSCPETRAPRYRLLIQNADSPPLAISGVTLTGPVYDLVLLGQPRDELRLDYGSPTAAAGKFDTAALRTSLAQGLDPLEATLEPQAQQAATVAEPWQPWNSSGVQITVIVLLTALLAAGLVQAARKVAEVPTDDGTPK